MKQIQIDVLRCEIEAIEHRIDETLFRSVAEKLKKELDKKNQQLKKLESS